MPDLRGAARRLGLRSGLKRAAGAAGFDLLTRNYYSPVPDLASVPPDVWTREDPLAGIPFDVDAQLRFVETELGAELDAIRLPTAPTADGGFHLGNGTYEGVDAEMLCAMVRRFRPRRIIELGSGASTLLIAEARRHVEAAGGTCTQVAYDPYARADLLPRLRAAADLRDVSAVDVPAAEIAELEAGDILFVDTTHVLRLAGDVHRIFLDILPRLAPGVIVHVHDIFLPYEYPIEFFRDLDVVWTEQYLLQAFLAFNPTYEILFSNHALYRRHGDALRRRIAGRPDPVGPSSLWLRRTGAA